MFLFFAVLVPVASIVFLIGVIDKKIKYGTMEPWTGIGILGSVMVVFVLYTWLVLPAPPV